MIILKSILFGLIQGATEFLPVSSSGHLLILHDFLSLPVENDLLFDVLLHLATFLAAAWYFRSDITKIIHALFFWRDKRYDAERRLGIWLALATVPAAIVGWLAGDFIEGLARHIWVVALMLAMVALIMILAERFGKRDKDPEQLSAGQSFIIGCAQALALIPGTSRSGATMVAGLFCGLKREAAVRFSFLMSLPIILGAALKSLTDLSPAAVNGTEAEVFSIAFAAALISGWLAIKYLLVYTKKYSLKPFAYYRLLLAAALLLYLFYSA